MRNLALATLSLAALFAAGALGCGGTVAPEEGVGVVDDAALDETGGGTVPPSDDASVVPGEDGSIAPPGEDGSIAPPLEDGGVAPPPPADASFPPPPSDAGGPVVTDASTGTGGIKCGTATCDSKTQDCCTSFSGQKCVTKGTCTGGATLSCTDSSACKAGEVCCASGGAGGGGAKCTTTCTMGIVLCATSAECKPGQQCLPGLGGTKTCRTPPPGSLDGGFGSFDGGGFGFDAGGFGFDAGGFSFDASAFGG